MKDQKKNRKGSKKMKSILMIIVMVTSALTMTQFAAADDAQVSFAINPPTKDVEVGETFTINITIDPNVTIDTIATDEVTFTAGKLNCTGVEQGDLFAESTFWMDGEIDNESGTVIEIVWGSQTTTSSPGTFVVMTFKAMAEGTAYINITKSEIGAAYAGSPRTTNITNNGTIIIHLYEPTEPSYFVAEAYNRTQINLTWENGERSDAAVIVGKLGSYPENRTDGTIVYNGSGLGSLIDYVYVAGGTTGSNHTIAEYQRSDLVKTGNTQPYEEAIVGLATDETYIYAGGSDQVIYQYWQHNLTKKAQSSSYGGSISAICVDDTYVYCAGLKGSSPYASTNVYQFWKSNMTYRDATSGYGGYLLSITSDGEYVYVGGAYQYNPHLESKVNKYRVSDMGLDSQSADYGGAIEEVVLDDTYVYAAGMNNATIKQYWQSNMTFKATTPSTTGFWGATVDDTYVYGAGNSDIVYQFWKSNMTLKAQSADYGEDIISLVNDDDYVYAGGGTPNKVCKYAKSNMTKMGESVSYGSQIYSLALGQNYGTPHFEDTGLGPSEHWYYRMWSWNETGGHFSDDYDEANATTDANLAPTFSNEMPENETSDVDVSLTNVTVYVGDPEGDAITVRVTFPGVGYDQYDNTTSNATYGTSVSGLIINTTYYWYVNVTDGYDWTNATYHFSTMDDAAPVFSNENPLNGSIDQPVKELLWNITIEDPDGDNFDWTIECSGWNVTNDNYDQELNATNGSKEVHLGYVEGYPLEYNTTYTIWVNATDGILESKAWYTFTTRDIYIPESPIALTATTYNRTRIDISWTTGADADYTYLCGKLGSTPSSRLDGFLYNDTGNTYEHSGLQPNEHWYYAAWSFNITDGTWSAAATDDTTTDVNLAPIYGTPDPTNGSTNNSLAFTWNISINDPEGDKFDWSINCSNGQNNGNVAEYNGTKNVTLTGLAYFTTYTVWVNATDIYSGETKEWYQFTTEEEPNVPPNMPTNEQPVNNTPYTTVYRKYFNVTVSDMDGDDLTVYFYWENDTAISFTTVGNNTVASIYIPDYITPDWLAHSTLYGWYVIVNDTTTQIEGPIYKFTTCHQSDVDEDQDVDITDVSIEVGHYGEVLVAGSEPWDIIEDASVDILDVSRLLMYYGSTF